MGEKPDTAGMPQPTEEHRKLHALLGDWEGEENVSPSPWGPGGITFGRYNHRLGMEGFFVVQDYVGEKQGRVIFRGHGVYGWDAAEKVYTWYWVDSLGQPPAAASRGRWEGDTLTFTSSSAQGQGRYTMRFEGPTTYHFKLENSFDSGQTWVQFMEATYRRTREG